MYQENWEIFLYHAMRTEFVHFDPHGKICNSENFTWKMSNVNFYIPFISLPMDL